MTLNEVKADLFNYFTNNDMFTMDDKEDFGKICVLSLNPPLDKQLIRASLKEFEKEGIVTDVNYPDELNDKEIHECWVLNKPIEQYNQSVNLTHATISAVTKIINQYCSQTNNPQSMVDPLSVQEKDIQSLVLIIHEQLGRAEEK